MSPGDGDAALHCKMPEPSTPPASKANPTHLQRGAPFSRMHGALGTSCEKKFLLCPFTNFPGLRNAEKKSGVKHGAFHTKQGTATTILNFLVEISRVSVGRVCWLADRNVHMITYYVVRTWDWQAVFQPWTRNDEWIKVPSRWGLLLSSPSTPGRNEYEGRERSSSLHIHIPHSKGAPRIPRWHTLDQTHGREGRRESDARPSVEEVGNINSGQERTATLERVLPQKASSPQTFPPHTQDWPRIFRVAGWEANVHESQGFK